MSLSLDRGTTQEQHHFGHAHGGAALLKALALTLAFAAVEAVAGLWSGSLALFSDAGHMLTDSASLGLATLAAWLARKQPDTRFTYGLVRGEILAALVNSLALLALIVWIIREAVARFTQPQPVLGEAVIVVALLGLGVNLVVACWLHQGEGLNARAAFLHVIGDLLGSVAALLSGLVIWWTGRTFIDPLLSIAVALLILVSALRLLRESLLVLMEAVPVRVDIERVAEDMCQVPGVLRVHDLHVWTLSSGQIALTAHLELTGYEDWSRILRAVRQCLDSRHGIRHVTLQPELQTP